MSEKRVEFFTADFDDDGDVDGSDLSQWQGDFGENDLSAADDDGDSDGADILVGQQQFGGGTGSGSTTHAAIPKPKSSLLPLVGAILCVGAALDRLRLYRSVRI